MRIKRNLILIILIVVLTLICSQVILAFSESMDQFIRDGKQVRLLVKDDPSIIILTPLNDLNLYDFLSGDTCQLKADTTYFGKPVQKEKSYFKVQLMATHKLKRAENFVAELAEQGFQDLEINKVTDWYKVRVGYFSARNEAEVAADKFIEKGYQSWVICEKAENQIKEIVIYDDEGRRVFQGKNLVFEGTIKLGEQIYPGTTEIMILGNGLKVFNTVSLQMFLAGVVANEAPSTEREYYSALQALAVIARTNFFYQLFNKKQISSAAYHGIGEVKTQILNAVNSTSGELLKKNGEIDEIKIDKLQAFIMARTGSSYRDILAEFKPGLELVDLKKKIKEELLVDAEIEWGLKYQEVSQLTWWGQRVISFLDIDLTRKSFYLEPVLANDQIAGLKDLNELMSRKEALAGINGGFFSYTGRPLGLFMINGQIVSEPVKKRTALIITENNDIFIEPVDWLGKFCDKDENKVITISVANRPIKRKETVIFNHYYGEKAPLVKEGQLEVVVSKGKVNAINQGPLKEKTQIPDEGFILQAEGADINNLIEFKIGETITYKNCFIPDLGVSRIVFVIGAGPTLIKDGQINITSKEEEFQADIAYGRAPRSAIGLTADKHLIMVTVDGRQPDLSIGISLADLAQLMLDRGVISAMNLDGGGSARMVVRGFTMNNPSAKRLISNGLVIKYLP